VINRKGTAVGMADELLPLVFVCDNAANGNKNDKYKNMLVAFRSKNFIGAI
jgi:hypothetical protein